MADPASQPQQDSGWIPVSTMPPAAPAFTSDPNGWQPLNLAPNDHPAPPVAPTVTPGEMIKGIGEGALQTGVGVADLAKRANVPGASLIPDSAIAKGRELAKPGSMGEQGGQMMEEMAEWAGGDEALKSVVKLAATPRAILDLIKEHPVASKILLDTMKGGAIGGAQGATKAAGAGESVKAGAEGGAAGGAVAGAATSAAEDALEFFGKKIGIGTTSLEDANKALQPKKTDLAFQRDWQRAAPTIGEKFRVDGKPKDMADGYAKVHEAANDLWNTKVAGPVSQRANDIPLEPLTGQPQNQDMIGDEIRKRITSVVKEHFPKRAEVINEIADRWGGHNPKTVGQINDEVTQFNAELAAKGYWKSTPEERAVMEKTDPETAAYVAANDELRDVLFSHLKASGMPDIDEDRKLYGALQHIGGEVRSRINVEGRRPGMSGKEFLGVIGGAARGGPVGAAIATAPMVEKAANQPQKVLARAAEKSLPESTGTKVAKTAGKVALKAGEAAAGVAGEKAGNAAWVTFKDKDGNLVSAHPEDAEEAMKRNGGVEIK